MNNLAIPYIPESAPFSVEQRAWLNGFFAGMHSQPAVQPGAQPPQGSASAPQGNPLLILFGSQTGTAEGLAKKLSKDASLRGFAPAVHPLNDHALARFSSAPAVVVISSTWGDGDPPDNATAFWNWLKDDSAPRLDGMQYAVLGLGDRNYSQFCGASKKMDERMAALGARQIIERGECDVDYEAPAAAWMESLWSKLGEKPSTNGSRVVTDAKPREPQVSADPPPPPAPVFNRQNPFPARLQKNILLSGPGSAKEVRHFEFDLSGSGLAYEAGDALGVYPENNPELVQAVASQLQAHPHQPVAVDGWVVPLAKALGQCLDLGKPSQAMLVEMARRFPQAPFAPLLAPGRESALVQWLHGRDVLDVLKSVPGTLPVDEFLPLLRKLSPRLYSISSSPKAHPGEVHLTVAVVRYSAHERSRMGVASSFLADRAGENVRLFIQTSHGFRPPSRPDAPMIMVGPGTGIAPFRAFLEERQAVGAPGRNWLFFGDQKRSTDYLYADLLEDWKKSGFLTRLDLAFSRDQAAKIYVQDRMRENAAALWAWLEEGAFFYVCGDASRMARDVDAALHEVIMTAGGKSREDAGLYVEKLKSEKRYQRDVY